MNKRNRKARQSPPKNQVINSKLDTPAPAPASIDYTLISKMIDVAVKNAMDQTVEESTTTASTVKFRTHVEIQPGDRVRIARISLGMSQQELAVAVSDTDSSKGNISAWETNKRLPSAAVFTKLSFALQVTEEWLRTGEY